MNSFIAKKLRLAFVVAFLALFVVSILLGHWRYGVKFSELMQQEFHSEKSSIQQLNQSFNSEFIALDAQGKLLAKVLEQKHPNTKLSTSNQLAYRVDLMGEKTLEPSLIEQQNVKENFDLLVSSIANLGELKNVQNAFFVWQDQSDSLRLLSDDSNFKPPTKALTWLALYSHQSKKLVNKPFFSPPFRIEQSGLNQNYMIYSFIVEHRQFFVLLELKPDIFDLAEFMELKSQAVLWHVSSGFLVYSNVEPQVNKYILSSNPLLAVSSLPLEIQKHIIYRAELDISDVEIAYPENEPPQIVTKMSFIDDNYQILLFKSGKSLIKESAQSALRFGLLIFLSGLLVLLTFLTFILRFLASPTSKLIQFIEQQSSVFEVDKPDIPKGWVTWFDKIQLSFEDNRNLLSNLTEKNKELDNKVKQRTRELMQQTISKDRNLALNRAMMNTIPDSLYYKNVSGGYLGCNKAYEKLVGLTEELLVAKTASDVFYPEKAAQIEKVEQLIISSNKEYIEQETLIDSTGQQVLIRWLYSPITNGKGEVLGILGLGQDITEQHKNITDLSIAAEEAERANKVKGQFIANISHEIRTPMNSIIGMLQLLQSSTIDANQNSYIKIAETSALNLLSVINNILDFSKASAEKLEVDSEVFSISNVLECSFANSAAKAMKKGVMLDTRLAPDFPEYLIGDEIKLGQIFTNLIGNAVKFTEKGSVVVVAKVLEQSGLSQKLCFEIRDTGIGIAPEQQEKVFEAFSQADNSVTREYGGTGLGLTISYQLVELLGGSIELESKVGKGTVFRIILDFERLQEQPEINIADADWLYWDHDEDVVALLSNKLKSFGLDTTLLLPDFEAQPDVNYILVCRPEALSHLPARIIGKIKSGEIKLQPVSYTYNPDPTLLSELPHLPMLTAPFNAQTMMLNIIQEVLILPNGDARNSSELAGINVLIVEDNKVNQQVLTLMLEAEGARVEVTDNGTEALKRVAQERFQLIITDVQMPNMDGITLIEKLRSRDEAKATPIIVVSAHTSEDDVSKSIKAGANQHLTKPINKTELVSTIKQLVNEPFSALLVEHINIEFLLSQFNDSVPIAKKVLLSFASSQQQEFESLCQEFEELEAKELKDRVHSYKGMLGNIGAESAYQASVEVEKTIEARGKIEADVFVKWQQQVDELFKAITQLQ